MSPEFLPFDSLEAFEIPEPEIELPSVELPVETYEVMPERSNPLGRVTVDAAMILGEPEQSAEINEPDIEEELEEELDDEEEEQKDEDEEKKPRPIKKKKSQLDPYGILDEDTRQASLDFVYIATGIPVDEMA